MIKATLPLFTFVDQPILEKSDGLLRTFEDIHNHIYANDGLSPEQALEETIKILFLKIYSEKNKKNSFKIAPDEYENIINGKTATEFTNRFRDLQQNTFNYFSSLFEKEEKIKLKSTTLAFVISKLQAIDLLSSSNDVKGLAFQKFIHSSQRVGRGQFFTPEQIIKMCVEIIQPRADENILDPACGSGGFLCSALQYITLKEQEKTIKHAKGKIYGIEINRTAAKIAKMRMILDGNGYSNVVQHDSLSDWSSIDLELNKANGGDVKTYQNYFDVILTNPPFGTQGKITNKSILRNYDLGYKWDEINSQYIKTNEQLNGQVPEILFIERCLKYLKPGGRMAIVLPNGDFENSSLSYLRYYIKELADVFAVVKLPQETFIPSGTGVKTSVLFLRKKNGKEKIDKVFFAQVTKLGYSGNKNGSLVYKKDWQGNIVKAENGDTMLDEDISSIISKYLNYINNNTFKEDENCFFVNENDLNYSRLDYEYYKPSHRKAEMLLSKNGAFRLRELVNIKKTKSALLKKKDLDVRYIELSDISVQYNEIVNSTSLPVHELPSRASYDIKEGAILTAVAGNSIGTNNHASAYVTSEYDGCICTNGFRVLIVNEKLVNPFYLLYYLKSRYFLDQVYRLRTGAAIPSILDSDLLNIYVLLPNIEEQNRIGNIIKEGFKQRRTFQEKINQLKVLV